MNYKKISIIKCIIGLSVLGILFLVAIYSEPNQEINFSAESGFYDEGFYLEIKADEGEKIYYTLDCSDPDENSTLYEGPIWIDDASNNENVYSMITDVSVDFNEELLNQAEKTNLLLRYGYKIPVCKIDKATIVRAVAVDKNGNLSEIKTNVYWVGYSQKDGYEGMNTISIITDPNNLFDYNKGIYVTGQTFDDFLNCGKLVYPITPNIGWWPGNYSQKGCEWEIPAYCMFFDADKKCITSGDFAIRIQGGSSRGFANKSLNIFSRSYCNSPTIYGNIFFGDFYGKLDSLNLYNGAHCTSTKLNDYLVNKNSYGLNVTTREFQPYQLFLDGEYWGVYWLTQRFEAEYFQERYGVYDDNVIVIKTGLIEVGNNQDKDLYNSMCDFVIQNDMSIAENYEMTKKLIDIDSCIDYYALEIYIANLDWPNNNFALWRTRKEENNNYADCRWRWIVFDVNLSMMANNYNLDMIDYAATRDAMFASLMYNDEFRQKLEDRLLYLAENNFNPDVIDEFIDEYESKMSAPMQLEYQRFYGVDNIDIFIDGCEDIRDFFHKRYDYITQKYGDDSQ